MMVAQYKCTLNCTLKNGYSNTFYVIFISPQFLKRWGAWVTQSVKHPILGFSSGHDLMIQEFEPCISADPTWDSLSPLSAPPPRLHAHAFSLSIKMNTLF